MPREFSRHQRLGPQILRTLNELVTRESRDPRLLGVSLTAVELSRDISVAKVYFSLLNPDDDPGAATAGLTSAAGFLRSRLGKSLSVRRVPELRFVHDESMARGAEIGQLIDRARSSDERD